MFGSGSKTKKRADAYIGCGGSVYLKYVTKWEYREDGVTVLTCTNGTVIELNPATACMLERVKEDD